MNESPKPSWTFAAFREGVIATFPLMPGLFAFGMAFGTVAARQGFSLLDAVAMSAIVFSGVAQIIVVDAWPRELTAASVTAIAAVTAVICSRFLLIGAAMRPLLSRLSPAQVYPFLHFLVEPPWLLSIRYQREGGNDPGFVIGSAATCYVTWVVSTAPGYWLGAAADPHRFGLDMVIPAFFTAMLVSLWQGPRKAVGWAVGGAVAVAADLTLGGFWYVVLGGLAGSVAGGLADEDGRRLSLACRRLLADRPRQDWPALAQDARRAARCDHRGNHCAAAGPGRRQRAGCGDRCLARHGRAAQ
jgi:predicted branched-subunit amino acid permease